MIYDLPKTVTIDGAELPIHYDYRVILTILELLNDPDLPDALKAEGMIELFFCDQSAVRNVKAAVEACYDFIDMGEAPGKKSPRVMDWEQDFRYIVAPVNRVLGFECREIPYDYENNTGGLHWWTFMGAYQEIGGDCLFSQIVNIRDKLTRGKKLEKYEKEWLNRNRQLVDLKQKMSQAENDLASAWMSGGKKHG